MRHRRICITAALAFLLGGVWACGSGSSVEPADSAPPDPAPDPQELTEERRAMYELDAARLALREMAKRDIPLAEQPIEIDPEFREELLEILLQVFHARHIPARDTVVEVYSTMFLPAIHTGTRWPVDEFSLRVGDPPPAWFEAWRNGETETGEPEFDALLQEFDLEVTRYFPEQDHLVLARTNPVNLHALLPRLGELPGVRATGGTAPGVGPSHEIRAQRLPEPEGAWRLDCILSYGIGVSGTLLFPEAGLPAWTFDVHPDGEVTFVESCQRSAGYHTRFDLTGTDPLC
jgi:hypothetical protein